MTTSGTQPKYTVDIWSGNHPFFKGSSSTVVVDEGRVNRFKRRYAGLDTMADMSTMKQGAWCLSIAHASRPLARRARAWCQALQLLPMPPACQREPRLCSSSDSSWTSLNKRTPRDVLMLSGMCCRWQQRGRPDSF